MRLLPVLARLPGLLPDGRNVSSNPGFSQRMRRNQLDFVRETPRVGALLCALFSVDRIGPEDWNSQWGGLGRSQSGKLRRPRRPIDETNRTPRLMKSTSSITGALVLLTLLHFATELSAASPGNRVLQLGGSGDYVEVADAASLDLGATLTLEAWINAPFVTPSGGQAVVSKRRPDGTASYDLGLVGGVPSFTVNGVAITGTAPVQTGIWTHLAGTYDGTTARLFVDGALVKESTTTQTLEASDYPLLIGRASYPGQERPFFGNSDEVRVWNVARTTDQIQSYRNTRLEGVETGLVGYWAWDAGTAADGSLAGNNGVLKGSAAIGTDDTLVLASPIFQKVVSGPIATDVAPHSTALWGDYDDDGWLDLFMANTYTTNRLYRNLGNGTFGAVDISGLTTVSGLSFGATWGDFDNDGWLDLFTASTGVDEANTLWRGLGDGNFQKVLGPVSEMKTRAINASWADFDNDGNLDLFVAVSLFEESRPNLLYRNLGGGVFSRVTTGNVATDVSSSVAIATADYDGDGDVDLFVGNSTDRNNFLYRNNGNGTFTKITAGGIVNDGGNAVAAAWADFDNDGDFDLFVSNLYTSNFLYRNDGNGSFTRLSSGAIVTDVSDSTGCAWGDYDNDGWLDLYLANRVGPNLLYHNDGNGVFTRVLTGTLVTDAVDSLSCVWGDYNNDGFLDLVVGNEQVPSALYRNTGNSNHWLRVRCVGTHSNRSGIGAQVRVLTSADAIERWQLRQISGDGTHGGQPNLEAHFGLGSATTVKTLRITWPSGRVQEFSDVPANQVLTIHEPPVLVANGHLPSGEFEVVLNSDFGFDYTIQASADLVEWMKVGALRDVDGSVQFLDPDAGQYPHRFYRAVKDVCTPVVPGLVTWWSAENGVADAWGAKDGQIVGGVDFVPGTAGLTFDFDGVDGGVIRDNDVAITNVNNWTLEAWVFWRGLVPGKVQHFIMLNGHPGLDGFALLIPDEGLCELIPHPAVCEQIGCLVPLYGGITHFPTGVRLPPFSWNHVALTRTGGELKLYLNGRLVFTSSEWAPNPPTTTMRVGNGGPDTTFNGMIDEASFWEVALTPEQVRAIYEAGAAGKCPP